MNQATKEALEACDKLGKRASVIFDRETHGPTVLYSANGKNRGLRSLSDGMEGAGEWPDQLVDEINIVDIWTFHIALYALQNPTPANVERALSLIGTSGNCEEAMDWESLLPEPVPKPNGWDDPAL